MKTVRRGDVVLVSLDPTIGSEIAKTRPALVVSPDEMNAHLRTVVVCPLISTRKGWPSRIAVVFAGQDGEVALDQVRAVDRARLAKRLGRLSAVEEAAVFARLVAMFA